MDAGETDPEVTETDGDTETEIECVPPEGWATYVYHYDTKWGDDGLYVFAKRQEVPDTCYPSECYSDPVVALTVIDKEGIQSVVIEMPDDAGSLDSDELDVSADGSRIAYPTDTGIAVIDENGDNIDSFDNDNYYRIDLSPDGSKAVLLSSNGWVVENVGGSDPETVAMVKDDMLRLYSIAWSPDGGRIAYRSYDPIAKAHALQMFDLETETTTILLDQKVNDLTWTTDGSALMFAVAEQSEEYYLGEFKKEGYIYRLALQDDPTPELIHEIYGAISPDATQVLQYLQIDDWDDWRQIGIEIMDLDSELSIFKEFDQAPNCC